MPQLVQEREAVSVLAPVKRREDEPPSYQHIDGGVCDSHSGEVNDAPTWLSETRAHAVLAFPIMVQTCSQQVFHVWCPIFDEHQACFTAK